MQRLDWPQILRLKDEEGLTFEEIAERIGKTKGAVYNAYTRAKAQESKPEVYYASKPSSKPNPHAGEAPNVVDSKPEVYSGGKPGVYYDRTLQDLLPALEEVVTWWRTRKQTLSKPGGFQVKRQTSILAEDLIAEVRAYAEQKGITVTEAVNQILRRGLIE